MARYKQFALKFTENQIAVIKRLLAGERLIRHRVRYINVRGCSPSEGAYEYQNGDKAPYMAITPLISQDIVKEQRTDRTAIIGYLSYAYAYSISEDVTRGIMDSVTPSGKSLISFLY